MISMAASMVDSTAGGHAGGKCETDGNFAVICSFFCKFGESLGISYNIQHLKDMIEDNENRKQWSTVPLMARPHGLSSSESVEELNEILINFCLFS